MVKASERFSPIMYADDTTLSYSFKMNRSTVIANIETEVNVELKQISTWLKLNKLSLNVQKTKFMLFHMPNKNILIPKLSIDGCEIERVSEFNFLGITTHENLKWSPHTSKIAIKISKTIGVLNRLKHYLPFNIRLLIYNSLIASHLQYGILVWGYDMGRLVKLQKRPIRTLTRSKYNAHTEPLFKSANLLKLNDMLKLNELKFYFKFVKKCLPTSLQNLPLNLNYTIHEHNTRSRINIHLTNVKHEFAKK